MAKIDWMIKGPWLTTCNCVVGCPCQFNALPSHGHCRAAVGCEIEHHTGHMTGRGADGLASIIHRADMVVILTDVNSHNAVLAARRLATARGCPHYLMRRCSPRNLVALIDQFTAQQLPVAS